MSFKNPVKVHLTCNSDILLSLTEVDTIEVCDDPLHFEWIQEKLIKAVKEGIGDLQRWRRDRKIVNLAD